MIVIVGNVNIPVCIGGYAVRIIKITVTIPSFSPRRYKVTVRGELSDAVIVGVHYKDVSSFIHRHIGWEEKVPGLLESGPRALEFVDLF